MKEGGSTVERFVLANFKMNKVGFECKAWVEEFLAELFKAERLSLQFGVAPSFPYIKLMKEVAPETGLLVGAQNMYFGEKGAFTGEVSVQQIKDLGADFVIIGHSERRHIFGETDDLLRKKLISALSHDILPVFCIGETKDERESGKTYEVLERQLLVFEGIPDEYKGKKVVVAYEPVWAIGTGIPATRDQIKEAIDFVRHTLRKYISDFSVLYGGSINEKVAEEIKDICDGGLVGSASLDPHKFYRICVNFQA